MDRRESRLKMPPGRANKDLDDYLERIFQYNRVALQKVADDLNNDPRNMIGWGGVSAKKLFVSQVKEHMRLTDDDLKTTIEKLGRTELFLSRTDRRLNNVEKTIRSDPQLLRRLRLINGWSNKLDWDKLSITQNSHIYRMGNIVIDFRNSPLEVVISEVPTVQDYDFQ